MDTTSNCPLELELLDRYLAGEASAEEQVALERWVAAAPGRSLAGIATAGFGVQHPMVGDGSKDRIWDCVAQTMQRGTFSKRPLRRMVITIGLCGFGAMLLAIQWQYSKVQMRESTHTYVTSTGERCTLRLSDGSRIVLGPRSVLTTGREFGTHTRTVSLSGEAYFDVTTISRIPFVVRTGAISTRVLGTRFNVRHDDAPTDPSAAVQVAVVSGRVIVENRRTSLTLTAGMAGLLTDSTAVPENNAAQGRGAWVDGRLVFNKTPASVMLAEIERWYGYTFRLADSSLATQRVIAVFRIDNAPETLRAIQQLLDVTMKFDGSTVTLRPVRRNVSDTPVRMHKPSITTTEIGK